MASIDDLDEWVPEKELAHILKKSPLTLRTWRARRRGPPWADVGRSILYPRSGIKKWLQEQVRDPAAMRRREARPRRQRKSGPEHTGDVDAA